MPIATHLAETPEELQFVRSAGGPFRRLLETLGKWDDVYSSLYNRAQHPIDWLEPVLWKYRGRFRGPTWGGEQERTAHFPGRGVFRRRWLLAHCNYVGDEQIGTLAETGASVAYCPIASEYFGHREHRYREMLDAGVNVCLGTDSILCQPADQPQPLGILPQMRRLYARDGTDPATLLAMATINGLRGLGYDEQNALLEPGAPTDLAGVKIDPDDPTDPLTQALRNEYPLRMLCRAEEFNHGLHG